MAEMREGDWECPVCGAICFASRETCFKCDKKAGGGGAGRREGDWDCPDCGAVVFASRDTCFKCERRAGAPAARKEGDWECPDCGALCFASRETCFKCERKGGDWTCPSCSASVFASKSTCFKCGEPKPGGAGAVMGGKGKGKGAAGGASVAAAFKALQGASPVFTEAWKSYCDLYGEGWQEAGDHQQTFLVELAGHLGKLLQADLQESTGQQEAAPAETGTKRPSSTAAAAAPPEKKKITVKKSVAEKIGALNAGGGLQAPIRLGAVAGALAKLEEEAALEALALLEEQQEEIEDPNEFLRSQAQ